MLADGILPLPGVDDPGEYDDGAAILGASPVVLIVGGEVWRDKDAGPCPVPGAEEAVLVIG